MRPKSQAAVQKNPKKGAAKNAKKAKQALAKFNGPMQGKRDSRKIREIHSKLLEMRAYKEFLAKEGLKPDVADKEKESKLIVRLLRLEKFEDRRSRQESPLKPRPAPSADEN